MLEETFANWVQGVMQEEKEGVFFLHKDETGAIENHAGYFSEESADFIGFVTDFLGEKRVEMACRARQSQNPPPPFIKGEQMENIWKNVPDLDLPADLAVLSNEQEVDFMKKVKQVKKKAEDGEVWVMNLCHKLSGKLQNPHTMLKMYAKYLQNVGVACGGVFWSNDLKIVSFSPELFVQFDGEKLITKPIKGTGSLEYLKSSQKEQSELMMVTDLLRNDLGMICEEVSVPVLRHYFPNQDFYHAYSVIEGQLDNLTNEKYEKMLPAGSVSGCPKVRSLEIIKKLENEARGWYCGTFGVKKGKKLTSGVLIRSIMHEKKAKNMKWNYGTGGGVTYKSNPEVEWQETLAKAEILRTLNN